MADGSFEREIAQLSEKYARHPASRIFAPLADAYRKAGRLDEATTVAQQGLRHHPDYVAGRVVLARAHYEAGELELASVEFLRALETDPQNLVALRALGEIARERDDALGSEAWYRRALEVDPANLELQERLEELSAVPGPAPDAPAAAPWEAGWAAGEPSADAASEAAPTVPEEWGSGAREEAPSAGGWDAGSAAAWGSGTPDAADAPAGEEHVERGVPEEIATVTLAEIYAEQGLHERALGIYRRILVDDPGNDAVRERAQRLEERVAEERARLDAEAGAALGGFVPGELRLTGDEVLTPDSPGESGAAGGAFTADAESAFPQAGGRRGTPEPWAFLLQDESDVDPDEVFGRATRTSWGERAPAARADAGGAPSPPASPSEDEDLRKFQEWLRSLQ